LRTQLLGKGGLAHGLHKVEKTTIYFQKRMSGKRKRYDVGKEDPSYLADLTGKVDYDDGKGSYRVVSMVVHRQETTRGETVLKVEMQVDVAVEISGARRREQLRGDYRLFGRRKK
jgi:DNA polymerase II small subunit/DNA polymerase delta subunit B